MRFQGGDLKSPLELQYVWDTADQLTSRTWNGQTLRYEYDPSGQLLRVIDQADNHIIEAYRYDLAGNMLAKILNNQLGAMTYNAANQLVASYDLGPGDLTKMENLPKNPSDLAKIAQDHTIYRYDKAGRLIGSGMDGLESEKKYGWLDKMTQHTLPDGSSAFYRYWPDGQLTSINPLSPKLNPSPIDTKPAVETFLWDGLALLRRNDTIYIIEPHPSGGIPIASHPIGKPQEITYHLNDLLGTTLATLGPAGLKLTSLSSFGQPLKAKTNSPNTSTPTQPSDPNQRQTTDGISPIR